jgi:hypothetical protein
VAYTIPGECPSYNLPPALIITECPATRPQLCTDIYNPVCGYFGSNVQCIQAPCAATYPNQCSACTDKNIAYTVAGACPNENPPTD